MPSRHGQSQHVFHLAGGDENGGAGGEPHNNGVGNKIDQRAQSGQTKGQLVDPGQKRKRQHHLDVRCRSRLRHLADGAEDDDGNGGGRAGN